MHLDFVEFQNKCTCEMLGEGPIYKITKTSWRWVVGGLPGSNFGGELPRADK